MPVKRRENIEAESSKLHVWTESEKFRIKLRCETLMTKEIVMSLTKTENVEAIWCSDGQESYWT